MREEEYIACAAIWYKDLPTSRLRPKNVDKGIVVCGHRHGHCIDVMKSLSNLRTVTFAPDGVGEHEQGFLTNTNRFVGREEAVEIAYQAKQIPDRKPRLFSEDIY